MADDLTPAERAELRDLLEQARESAARDLAASSQDAEPVDLDLSIGRLSRVDAMQQQHMALARRRRVELTIQQIQAALVRLERGGYGLCLECDQAIAFARLRARPQTPWCLECQQAKSG